jgi:hypothetical protein
VIVERRDRRADEPMTQPDVRVPALHLAAFLESVGPVR